MQSIIHSTNLEEIIEFLKNEKIISKEAPFCIKCKINLQWRKRCGSSDIYTWKCTKCDTTCSIRRNSFLQEFKIPLMKVVKLIHAFAFEHKIEDVCVEIDLSKPTVIKFYRRLREMVAFECDIENLKLGGLGETIEIDESKFMKVKHGVGKDLKRRLVCILSKIFVCRC